MYSRILHHRRWFNVVNLRKNLHLSQCTIWVLPSCLYEKKYLNSSSTLRAGIIGNGQISSSTLSTGVNRNRQIVTSTLSTGVNGNRQIATSALSAGVNVRPMKITSSLAADQLVRDLDREERDRLIKALQYLKEEQELENVNSCEPPNMNQLMLIACCNSIPFIGFGFLDNAIMIAAGEYIDNHIGVTFGISTMAAAALGNMISDVAGIGLAGYVEILAARLGIEEPKLKPSQVMMKQTRFASYSGRAVGIVIGCIIGMFPLLFLKHEVRGESPPKVNAPHEF